MFFFIIVLGVNLISTADREQQNVFSQYFLPAFLPLLSHRNGNIRATLCSVLVVTISAHKVEIPTFIASGIVTKFVSFLKNPELAVITRALELVRAILSARSTEYTEYLIEQGTLPMVCALTRCANVELAKEAMYVASGFLRESKGSCRLHEVVMRQLVECGAAGTV